MDRAAYGFLVGFFLATFILMAAVRVELGQWESSMGTVLPAAQTLYDITHGEHYSDILSLASWANETAGTMSSLPLIGALVPKEIPDAASRMLPLLDSGRQVSETLISTLNFLQFLLGISVPIMAISSVMVVAGAYLLMKPEKKKIPKPTAQ